MTEAAAGRRRRIVCLVSLAALALAGGFLAATPAEAAASNHQALTTASGPLNAPDPGVLHIPSGAGAGWYIYSTAGDSIKVATAPSLTAPFTQTVALTRKKAQSDPTATTANFPSKSPDGSDDMWAPSVSHIGSNYVMYFVGYDASHKQRCISVAQSSSPAGPFARVPGTTPICAPSSANAMGKVAEAIDPSFFQAAGGQRYLIFKAGSADRYNVAIWSVAMTSDGLHRAANATPKVVLASTGSGLGEAIENPDVISHGGKLYLFVSNNYYRSCSYNTEVYSASSLTSFTNKQTPHKLLTQNNTTLCGPGGASVTTDGSTIVYHAWNEKPSIKGAKRVDYTAHLTWSGGWPTA